MSELPNTPLSINRALPRDLNISRYDPVINIAEMKKRMDDHESQHSHGSNSSNRQHCEDRLEEIAGICFSNSAKHTKQAQNAQYRHDRLTLPSIMVAAIGGAIAYVPVGTDVKTQGTDWIPIVVAIVSTINTILVGIINYCKFEYQTSRHTEAAKNYQLLGGEIRDYLVKMPKGSETWFIDLKAFRGKLADIVMSAPLIL